MKNFKASILIAVILIGGFAFDLAAQTRPEKTSSAKAYYGSSPERPKYKMKKKHKIRKYSRSKPAKGTDRRSSAYRRKSSHGNI